MIAALAAGLAVLLYARRGSKPQLEPAPAQSEERTADPLLEALEPQPKERVLQLGLADDDELTFGVAERLTGGKLEVFDREQGAVDALVERARTRGLRNVSGWHGDPDELLFETDRFDAACVLADDVPKRELERVVKPGGRLVVREGERYVATLVAPAEG